MRVVELAEFFVAVHEGLRRDEAAGERDVQLARVRLAPQLDAGFLRLALAEAIFLVHEDGRHAVGKLTVEIGIAWKMDPPEFLNRRNERRELNRIDRAVDVRET